MLPFVLCMYYGSTLFGLSYLGGNTNCSHIYDVGLISYVSYPIPHGDMTGDRHAECLPISVLHVYFTNSTMYLGTEQVEVGR